MCTGVEIAMLVVAVVGTAASVSQASKAAAKQQQALEDQAFAAAREAALSKQLAEMEANSIRDAAADKAEKIRDRARIVRGAQAVAAANSGFLVGEGTSLDILTQTSKLADQDVLATLYDGINGFVSKNLEGDFALRAGNNRATSLLDEAAASRIRASGGQTSTLIRGVGQVAAIALA